VNKLGATANRLRNFFTLIALLTAVVLHAQGNDPDPATIQDSIPASQQVLDTVPQISRDTVIPAGPITIERNKRYLIGGVSIVGNETISEQSILIFSGLSTGQRIKIPGDKLSSAIKKLWTSKLFSNVDVYVTKIDGDAIYLEITVKELDKVGKVTITGLKKSSSRMAPCSLRT